MLTQEHLEKSYKIVFRLLGQKDLIGAAQFVRALQQQFPEDQRVYEAAGLVTSLIRRKLPEFVAEGEFLTGEERFHYDLYTVGIEKRIRYTRAWPEFCRVAQAIIAEGRTLLKFDRLFSIYQALTNVRRLEGDILELGVYRGGSAKFIAEICRMEKMAVAIHALDTFAGHAALTAQDGFQGEVCMFKDNSIQDVRAYLADREEIELVAGSVVDTLEGVLARTSSIRFAHLDMDLWEPTAYALPLIADRLVAGGVMLVDDYGNLTCDGVKKAVDAFVAGYAISGFYLMTGQYLLMKP